MIKMENNINEMKPYERKVAYYETDRMGIVHHSNYIRWLEEARLYYMDCIGLDYEWIEENGILIPVLTAECKYRIPFRYGDTFLVYPRLTKFNGVKMCMDYEIYKKDSDYLHSTASTSHCFVDTELKPINIKKHDFEIYSILKDELDRVWRDKECQE